MKARKERLTSERLRWWRCSNKPPCCKGPCGKELASRSWAWPRGDSKEVGLLVLQPQGEKFCQWEIRILWKALYIFVIFQLWTKRRIPYSPELHIIWVSGHTSTYRESHVSPKNCQQQLTWTECGMAFPPYVVSCLLEEKRGDFKV